MEKQKNLPVLRFPEFTDNLESRKLGEISSWSSGGTPSKEKSHYWNGNIPWITASSMHGFEYFDSENKITEEGLDNGSRLAKEGQLLILVRGSMLFNKIPVGIALRDVAFNQDVKSIDVSNGNSTRFILYWFFSNENVILDLVTGTGIGAGKLDLSDLKNLTLQLPALPEQTKIATFLTSVDDRLNQLKQKKSMLEQYKKGVMQKIFDQEIRFKDDEGNEFPDWEEKYGNYIFESISDKKHNSDLPILAITQEYGAIPRELIDFNISVTDKSVESYKVVQKGDFIISLRSFQGGIEYSNYKGICSPAYIILRSIVEVDNNFYKYYFKTETYIKFLNLKLEGIRDGKMISYNYFSDIKLPYPCPSEQTKIANFLSVLDEKISLCNTQIAKTEQYKKGLLQQMFV